MTIVVVIVVWRERERERWRRELFGSVVQLALLFCDVEI
jgi:hypothetical protein